MLCPHAHTSNCMPVKQGWQVLHVSQSCLLWTMFEWCRFANQSQPITCTKHAGTEQKSHCVPRKKRPCTAIPYVYVGLCKQDRAQPRRIRILQVSASQHSRSLVPITAIMFKSSWNLDSLLRSGKPRYDQAVRKMTSWCLCYLWTGLRTETVKKQGQYTQKSSPSHPPQHHYCKPSTPCEPCQHEQHQPNDQQQQASYGNQA